MGHRRKARIEVSQEKAVFVFTKKEAAQEEATQIGFLIGTSC